MKQRWLKPSSVMAAALCVGLSFPHNVAAQSESAPSSPVVTVSPGEWFIGATKRETPDKAVLEQTAKLAVDTCPGKIVKVTGVASGDRESDVRNRHYAKDREHAGVDAVGAMGGQPVSSGVRFTGVGDEHGRGVLFTCVATVQTITQVVREVGAAGANCYDGLGDVNRDGVVNVMDCRVQPPPPDTADSFRFLLGACAGYIPEPHGVDEDSGIVGGYMSFQFRSNRWWGKLTGCGAGGPDNSFNAVGEAVIVRDITTWLQFGPGVEVRGMYINNILEPRAWAVGPVADITWQPFNWLDATVAPSYKWWADNAVRRTGRGPEVTVWLGTDWPVDWDSTDND